MELKKYYVYEWFIKSTNEVIYVGKGSGNRYKYKKRENRFFMLMIETHECSSRIVKEGLTEDEAFSYEIELIKYYRENTNYRLTNIADGGENPPTYYGDESYSKLPEVRAKISKSNRELWKNEEYRERMSSLLKEYYKTEEGKSVASNRSKKNWENKEFRDKVINKMTSTTQSEEYRKEHSKRMKEAYASEEIRNKVRGSNNGNSRKVKQLDLSGNLIAEFNSLIEITEKTGLDFKNISKALKGYCKTAYGYKWEYNDDKDIVYKKRKPYNPNVKRKRIEILQYDLDNNFIREYSSSEEAARINNFKHSSNIRLNLIGKTKSAYGFIWKKKYEYDNTEPSSN